MSRGNDECTGCGTRFDAPEGRAVPLCDACLLHECKLRQALGKHRGDCPACAMKADQKPARKPRTTRKPKGPKCGHSACSQNYIDSGETACFAAYTDDTCASCGDNFQTFGMGRPSPVDPSICSACYCDGEGDE